MKKNELLTKDIKLLIKQIAIPSSIGMFFNTMYNVVDTFYVGMISTVAITALSYSFIVFFMILSISFGLSSAITAHVGHSLGKHKEKLAKIFVINGITYIGIVSILLSLIGYIFLEDIFNLMGAKNESLSLSLEYTNIILIGTVPMILGLGANAVLLAKGDTKSYRNTLIFGFFLNLFLDPLFIYGYAFIPAFGFAGVAYATVLIQFITAVYIFIKLYQTKLFNFEVPKMFLPDMRIYKQLSTQAIPMSISMFVMSLGTMIIMYFVSFYGYKTVAAFGIGYRVEQIILLPMLGLNTAVSAIVANNFGAKNFDRIHEVINKSLKYGYIMSAIGVVFLAVFGKYIVMIFDTDIEVIETAYIYIMIESVIFFAFITLFICTSTLQGIKQPFIIPYVSLYRQVVMPFILLYTAVVYFEVTVFTVWIIAGLIIYSAAIWIYFYMRKKLESLQ
ncbi:MAG: putative MATE family efflux protein [Arcobacteraceae bacterium]|jgi:putative MATE family efflux protein